MVDPFFNTATSSSQTRAGFDEGLRAHMQRIFGMMAGGLALTGIVAFLVSSTALMGLIFGTPLKYVAMLAPFGFMMYLNLRLEKISLATAQMLFWLFSGTMGLSLGTLFYVYTSASIAQAFMVTSATFAGMSLWGYTTKRSLTGLGAFMAMGLMGVILASLFNLVMGSSMLSWMMSVASVVIFTGLTAYDVQQQKNMYVAAWGREVNAKLAVVGALQLYMNFLNIFLSLLRLMGDRR